METVISQYWEQLLLIGALIFHAARSYAQLSEMRKDIDQLQNDMLRYSKWTQLQAEQITTLRAEMDVCHLGFCEQLARPHERRVEALKTNL